jgi:sulfite dehydrogenase
VNTRRKLLAGLAAPALASLVPEALAKTWQPAELPEGAAASGILEALPGKLPLIKRSYRPPNFETPIDYFREPITRNDAFFVRYHLAGIPTVDAKTWRLKVGGDAAANPLELDFARLRKEFPVTELVAVCQCSGNRRGMSSPHVQGVEWGVGAMGNAKWTGVRLKDILQKAGVTDKAVEVAFDGADSAPMAGTPDFVKSIPIERAMDESTLIAFEMNGKPLPHWNGFPARLIVSGWTGTYWMKHLVSIQALSKKLGGFWMDPAYRIPAGMFPSVDPFKTQATDKNQPITDILVNSLVTSVQDGQRVKKGQMVDVAGVAWDGGRGIRDVEISLDDGHSWFLALLGKDLGRYSFRTFSHQFRVGDTAPIIRVRAYNARGDTQVEKLLFNPAGYHNNVVQRIRLEVA